MLGFLLITNVYLLAVSNDNFLKTDIKNCTCYYLDDIIKIEDFDLDNMLIEKKPFENTLVYNISYKRFLIDSKPLCIRLTKTWI